VSLRTEWAGRWYEAHVEPYRDPDGRTTGVLGIALDVTERRRAEDELQRTLSMLQSTLDSTADGILEHDGEGRIATYNRRFGQVWGLPPELLATRDVPTLLAAALQRVEEPDAALARLRELQAHPDAAERDRIRMRDGRVLEHLVLPQRLDGRIVGHVLSFREIEPAPGASPVMELGKSAPHGRPVDRAEGFVPHAAGAWLRHEALQQMSTGSGDGQTIRPRAASQDMKFAIAAISPPTRPSRPYYAAGAAAVQRGADQPDRVTEAYRAGLTGDGPPAHPTPRVLAHRPDDLPAQPPRPTSFLRTRTTAGPCWAPPPSACWAASHPIWYGRPVASAPQIPGCS
jgi:PAS domain S-box-containing protein